MYNINLLPFLEIGWVSLMENLLFRKAWCFIRMYMNHRRHILQWQITLFWYLKRNYNGSRMRYIILWPLMALPRTIAPERRKWSCLIWRNLSVCNHIKTEVWTLPWTSWNILHVDAVVDGAAKVLLVHFSDNDFFYFVGILVTFFKLLSYFTCVTTAEMQWYLSNTNMINRLWLNSLPVFVAKSGKYRNAGNRFK